MFMKKEKSNSKFASLKDISTKDHKIYQLAPEYVFETKAGTTIRLTPGIIYNITLQTSNETFEAYFKCFYFTDNNRDVIFKIFLVNCNTKEDLIINIDQIYDITNPSPSMQYMPVDTDM